MHGTGKLPNPKSTPGNARKYNSTAKRKPANSDPVAKPNYMYHNNIMYPDPDPGHAKHEPPAVPDIDRFILALNALIQNIGVLESKVSPPTPPP